MQKIKKYDGFIFLLVLDTIIAFNYLTFNNYNIQINFYKFSIYYIFLSIVLLPIYLFTYDNKRFIFWIYLLVFLIIKELFVIYFYIGSNF